MFKKNLFVFLLALNIHCFSQVCFTNLGYFETSATPKGLTVADFNNDGFKDIATSHEYVKNITILYGQAAGTFSAPTTFSVPYYSYSIASADFNNDGKMDIAATQNGNQVIVLTNNGTGTSFTQQLYNAYSAVYSIIAEDFNNDGFKDIATVGGSNSVSVLMSTGTGSFSTAGSYITGNWANGLTSGDFNNDGRKDIAIACKGSNVVCILKANTTGGFAAATYVTTGTSPFSITSGDFNNDGILDLATANSTPNQVSILKGLGAGTFTLTNTYAVTQSPVSISCGDFNGDSKLDLVTSNSNYNSNQDNASFLLGSGTGTFSYYGMPLGQQTDDALAITNADVNNDGTTDIVTTNNVSHNCTVVYLCGTTTGMKKLSNDNSVTVYPNPSSDGYYNIESEDYIKSVTVYNAIGETVLPLFEFNSTRYTLNLSKLKRGIYFVKIEGNKTFFQKIIYN